MKTVHSRQVSWAPVGTKKKTSYPFRHVHVLQIVREIDSELFQGFVKTCNLEDDNSVVQWVDLSERLDIKGFMGQIDILPTSDKRTFELPLLISTR